MKFEPENKPTIIYLQLQTDKYNPMKNSVHLGILKFVLPPEIKNASKGWQHLVSRTFPGARFSSDIYFIVKNKGFNVAAIINRR